MSDVFVYPEALVKRLDCIRDPFRRQAMLGGFHVAVSAQNRYVGRTDRLGRSKDYWDGVIDAMLSLLAATLYELKSDDWWYGLVLEASDANPDFSLSPKAS